MNIRHDDLPNIAFISFTANASTLSLALLIFHANITIWQIALAAFLASAMVSLSILIYYKICGGYPITASHIKLVLSRLRG